jgi:hypothetical protein
MLREYFESAVMLRNKVFVGCNRRFLYTKEEQDDFEDCLQDLEYHKNL